MGIPDNVTEILLSASRQSTRKIYQSAWRRWSSWCYKRKIDPFSAPLTDILLYLTEYFNSGAAYRSVNVARSAISTSHAKLNGLPVGQNPLVIQLLKGAQSRLNGLKSLSKLFNFVFESVSIFSTLNHPCSFMLF